MIANIGLRKKVIMSERADPRAQFNNLPWKDKIGNFFMRKCGLFSLADWMVFQTPDAQSYYSEKIQKKSSIIPNPLDIDKLPERYDGEREKRIVAAGRFSEEKNFALLIDGFATFHESFPDYTLALKNRRNILMWGLLIASVFIQRASLIYAIFPIFYFYYKKNKMTMKKATAFIIIGCAVGYIGKKVIIGGSIGYLTGGVYANYASASSSAGYFFDYIKLIVEQVIIDGYP